VKITVSQALEAAKRHGECSDPDHEVGDLQDMVLVAYKLMTKEQREKFLNSNCVKGLIETELS